MVLNKERRRMTADYFVKFSLALLSALVVQWFFGGNNISNLVYLFASMVVILSFVIGMFILPSENTKDIMPTEIKKGVIHIQNATVSNGK